MVGRLGSENERRNQNETRPLAAQGNETRPTGSAAILIVGLHRIDEMSRKSERNNRDLRTRDCSRIRLASRPAKAFTGRTRLDAHPSRSADSPRTPAIVSNATRRVFYRAVMGGSISASSRILDAGTERIARSESLDRAAVICSLSVDLARPK